MSDVKHKQPITCGYEPCDGGRCLYPAEHEAREKRYVLQAFKLFLGNYDGRREGLVYAKSKKAAARIAGCSVRHFNDYWSVSDRVVQHAGGAMEFDPETLYTRQIGSHNGVFFKGRCAL